VKNLTLNKMSKYKIVFEGNAVTSCRPTTRFIGDKEKDWSMDWSMERKKKFVEVLVNADTKEQALKLAKQIYAPAKAFHSWRGEIISTGGSFNNN
jgi:hypothetical protein